VAARVTADFRSGVRVGVVGTPTLFIAGERWAGRPTAALWARLDQ
jgi:protein-disulfide isomerase